MDSGAKRIVALMSGGVDSSVTAMLLRDAGWSVVGVTMKIPTVESGLARRPCCGTGAAFVCKDLGIPHYFVDTEESFLEYVVEPFRRAYAEGRTPSPCVDCNASLKFGLVWDLLRERLGIEHIATGHYARVEQDVESGDFVMRRGVDKSRDQSYFLYRAPRERLPFLHLPLGGFAKTAVREIAASRGVVTASKPDSMELCFAAEGDYRKLLPEESLRPGPILDESGKVLGEHKGIQNYTIGQRRGLGISSPSGLYVIDIIPGSNSIVVGPRESGFRAGVCAGDLNVLQPEKLAEGAVLLGKIRSVGEPELCRVARFDGAGVEVCFDEPTFGPAPGQHLALYDDSEALVAGGVIIRGLP
jgi:tRNA-specific 2-thiouridylase